MYKKRIIYFVLIVLLFIALVLGIIILTLKNSQKMEVNFLNVGQGDAILIENGNKQILIDGGRSGKVAIEKLGEAMPFWDRKIELIIITHPDSDHYGGLDEVLNYYEVVSVIKTEVENESGEWENFKEEIKKEKSNIINSSRGTIINFPNGARLEIIYPFYKVDETKDKNDLSIVTKLEFGENQFLLTGDLSLEGERELLSSGLNIEADVLKVGHHGSRSSSSDEFLERVSPKEAIILVGAGNSYGHPHKEILEKLEKSGIKIWRTDKDGTIKYICPKITEDCQKI